MVQYYNTKNRPFENMNSKLMYLINLLFMFSRPLSFELCLFRIGITQNKQGKFSALKTASIKMERLTKVNRLNHISRPILSHFSGLLRKENALTL